MKKIRGLYKRISSQLPEGCPINGLIQVECGVHYRCVHHHECGRKYILQRRVIGTNGDMSELMHGTFWEDTAILCSLRPRTVQLIVPEWHPTGMARHLVVFFPTYQKAGLMWAWLSRGAVPCGIRSQPVQDLDQVARIKYRYRSLLPLASLVRPCFPGPAKRRLSLRKLG